MKYITQPGIGFLSLEEGSETLLALQALSPDRRPTIWDESDTSVQAWISGRAEAAKPKEVTMRQARLALRAAGLLPNVEAAIAAMTGPAGDDARIEWEYSNSLKRSQPLVAQLGAGLGLSAAHLDALFLTASTL